MIRLSRHDRTDCWRALDATIDLYRKYRADQPPPQLHPGTEHAVVAFIAAVRSATR